MAAERLKQDANRRNVAGAVTDDVSLEVRMLRVDPITNRLLVDADVTLGADLLPVGSIDALAVAIVDGSGNQITSFGGGVEYTEGDTDATIVGKAVLMEAAGNTLVPFQGSLSDGLLVNLGANNDISGTITANAGTNLNTSALALESGGNLAAAATSLALLDDAIVADDAAFTPGTTKVMMSGFQFDDTTPDSVNEGDAGAARMSANRNIYTTLRDAAGNERGVNVNASNALLVTQTGELPAGTQNIGDVDVASVIPGTAASNLGKAEDAAHTTGDVGVMALAVANEANTARAADGDYLPIATDSEGNVRVVGNRDHDAVDAGEVLGVGGRAIAHGTNPTAVAAADRTVWYFNRAGVPFMIGGHPNAQLVQLNITDADGAQTNTAIISVSSGTKIVVTHISVIADHANTGDVQYRIGFGTASTPANDAAKVLASHPGCAPGSGIVLGNGGGILGIGADDEDLRITCEDPAGGSLDIVVGYYTIES